MACFTTVEISADSLAGSASLLSWRGAHNEHGTARGFAREITHPTLAEKCFINVSPKDCNCCNSAEPMARSSKGQFFIGY